MSPKSWVETFPIRIHDVDAAGIVFFARYFVLMHDVYESFLAGIGHSISSAIAAGRIIIPVVESHCRYRRPMRHGETITATLVIRDLKHSSYAAVCQFAGPAGDLRAILTVRHVCVDAGTMKPIALPADLHAALAAYVPAEAPGEAAG